MYTPAFDIGFAPFFGLGVSVYRWNSGKMIVISLPFVAISFCTDPTRKG